MVSCPDYPCSVLDVDSLAVEFIEPNDEHRAESCSSSFALLLKQLAWEHDREITKLRLEIARLTGDAEAPAIQPVSSHWIQGDGEAPAIQPVSSLSKKRSKEEIQVQKQFRHVSFKNFHEAVSKGTGIARAGPALKPPHSVAAVASEIDLGLLHQSHNKDIMPAIASEHTPLSLEALETLETVNGHASPDDNVAYLPRGDSNYTICNTSDRVSGSTHFSSEAIETSMRGSATNGPPSGNTKSSTVSSASAMTTASSVSMGGLFGKLALQIKDSNRMKNWHILITRVQAFQRGDQCVEVDPIWCTVAHDAPEALENAVMAMATRDDKAGLSSLGTFLMSPVSTNYSSETSTTFAGRLTVHLPRHCVLHPNSMLRIVWDLTGMLLLLHDCVAIPLQVFESGTRGLSDTYIAFWQTLDMIAAVFWTCDIIVSFLSGYYSELGFVEDRHAHIARHYLKTWFPLDFTIVFVDWCTYAFDLDSSLSEVGFMRLGKTVSRFLRIARLLRFSKMSEKFSKLLERINSEYILTLVGVTKLVFGIIMVNHYIACTWYWLAQMKSEKTWTKENLADSESMGYAYVTSLHWSLTQFTPASMEVVATNKYERIYTIVVIIAAMVAFSSLVSSITGAMTHLRHINAKKAEQDSAFRAFFSSNKISQELASQVWNYRHHCRRNDKTRMKESDLPAFTDLPDRMQKLLRFEVYSPWLQRHPFFALYAAIYPEALRMACHEAMGERHVSPGEELKDLPNPTDRMIFVCCGHLEYVFDDPNKTCHKSVKTSGRKKNSLLAVDVLGTSRCFVSGGQWALELSLWSQVGRISGSLCGGDNGCELMYLHRKKFQLVALKDKGSAHLVSKYANSFVQRFNESCIDPDFPYILFNDQELVRDMVEDATCYLLAAGRMRGNSPRRQSAHRRSGMFKTKNRKWWPSTG